MRKTTLTFYEAVDVWLRYWSGQYQHDIAADYGVNPRCVNDVLKERTHTDSKQIAASNRDKRRSSPPVVVMDERRGEDVSERYIF
jgi:hypothetical protein